MSDPFQVIGAIPDGMTYQWSAIAVAGDPALARFSPKTGWTPVPADRHPEMPSDYGNFIVIGDQMLMERSTAECEASRQEEITRAKVAYDTAKGGSDGLHGSLTGDGTPWVHRTFDPAEVAVSITLRLSASRVEAAAICRMTVEKYAHALVQQIIRGFHGPIHLVPTADNKAFELREEQQ